MAIRWGEYLRRLRWLVLTAVLLLASALIVTACVYNAGCIAQESKGPATVTDGDAITGQVAIGALEAKIVALEAIIGELTVAVGGNDTITGSILAIGLVVCLFVRAPQDTKPGKAIKRWFARGPPST